MKRLNALKFGAVAGAFLAAASPGAYATGTDAGTTISNTATVNFSVGGTAQAAIGSSPAGNSAGAGEATTFLVDRELSHTVAGADSSFTVASQPNNTAYLTFTVTNTGNDAQDYLLRAVNRSSGTDADYPGGVTDAFDASGLQVFVDVNGNGTYEAGTDTATYIDELGEGVSRTVFVVGTIPALATNGQYAAVTLVAQVAAGGTGSAQGAAIVADTNGKTSPAGTYTNGTLNVTGGVASTTADSTTTVQNVFRDGTSDLNSAGADDAATNGQHSDTELFFVQTAFLTVTKTSAVISDPVNGTTSPKAIPGAVIRYTISVANTGSTAADSVVVRDAIPSNTTYKTATITLGGAGKTDAADGDQADYNVTNPGFVTVNVGTVGTTTTSTITFDVTLN